MSHPEPLLAAGHVTCSTCAAVAYPSEGLWLDNQWLIASFPAPCEHVTHTLRLIMPVALPLDRRCQATTRTGMRCKLTATTRGWCSIHLPGAVERHPQREERR